MPGTSHYRSAAYFDAVRRHGSVREAARHLGLAASAVNRQILNLEAELGMPLFERLPGGMRLTAAGEVMARHAIAVLQDEKRVFSEFDALRGLRRGEIAIAAAESLNANFLPELMGQMAGRYPGIKVRVRTAGSNDIPDALRRGEADLGIVRADHPLAREAVDGTITFAQCTRHALVLPGPELSIHSLLSVPLRRYEGRLHVAAEVNSLALMKNLTLRLNAVTFQSRIGLEAELAAGAPVFLGLSRPGPMVTELGIFLRQGRSMPTALDVFVNLAREMRRIDGKAPPPQSPGLFKPPRENTCPSMLADSNVYAGGRGR